MNYIEESARHAGAGGGAMRAYELVRKELLSEFQADFFGAYIDDLRLLAEWNGQLVFRAPSAAAKERLNQQVKDRLEARLRAHLPGLGGVLILIEREIPDEVRALIAPRPAPAESAPAEPVGADSEAIPAEQPEHPHSYTFDSFCVDHTNFRAFTVAQMIAGGAGIAFPVVLLHSPPGAGKSHLIHAIQHEMKWRAPERKVLLMSGQEFLESFQSALHKSRDGLVPFKDRVRAPEVLLIDDFQRLCGKKATCEEIFHTISELTRRGRQVVLTANHSAQGLEGLDDQLREKLKGATTCEIMEPGLELRRRILDMRVRHYARVRPGFAVAPAALDMIAERMPVSGRELDGAVSQLVIEAKISGGMEVSVEAAANALQNKLADSAERRITVQLVQKVVARYFNMSVPQLLERTRRQAVARPRQIGMHLAAKLTHASLPDIGQRFGGFDHTTIMYARDRISELMETDGKLRLEIDTLMRLIRREP
jgi:chromosomal replication initiator protein